MPTRHGGVHRYAAFHACKSTNLSVHQPSQNSPFKFKSHHQVPTSSAMTLCLAAIARPWKVPATARPRTVPATARPRTVPATARPRTVPATARPRNVPATARPWTVPATARPWTVPATARPWTVDRACLPQPQILRPPADSQMSPS